MIPAFYTLIVSLPLVLVCVYVSVPLGWTRARLCYVLCFCRSCWGFTVKQGGRTVHEDNGAHRITISSLTMEVEAVTHTIQWLASQCDAQITHAIIITDSMNLLKKVESGMGCPDWHTAMQSSVDLLSWARRSQWE